PAAVSGVVGFPRLDEEVDFVDRRGGDLEQRGAQVEIVPIDAGHGAVGISELEFDGRPALPNARSAEDLELADAVARRQDAAALEGDGSDGAVAGEFAAGADEHRGGGG